MNGLKKALDTLRGKALDDAAEEVAKTAADLKDAVRRAREKLDAERSEKEAQAREGK